MTPAPGDARRKPQDVAPPVLAATVLVVRWGSRVELTQLGNTSLDVVRVPGRLAKLDHCVTRVSDWAVSDRFYRDVLGAELTDRGDGTWA